MKEKTLKDKATEDKEIEDNAVKDKVMEDNAVKDKVMEDNAVKDKVMEDKTAKDKVMEDKTAKDKEKQDKEKNKAMKENKKRMSGAEAFQINNRAFMMTYKRYPQMVLSNLIDTVWSSLSPYVSIYFSALVIDELVGNRDVERLKFLVAAILVLTVVISLISAFLTKWKRTQCPGYWFRNQQMEQIFSEKLFNMDFGDIDDTKTHELLSSIRQNQNSGGWGLTHLMGNYNSLISSILTILGGITLTVSLFVSKVPESEGAYVILNNPLFLLLVIMVMLAVTYIAPTLSNKADSYWALNVDNFNIGNRLFSFFGWLGYKKKIASDVRIYRQDKMCDRYNCSKDRVFGSKGFFARYSIGPIGLYNAASAAISVIFTGVVYAFVCLKAWGGAFGLGSVTQYISSITKVSGGVSSLIATVGEMRNNGVFLAQVFQFLDIPNTMYQGSLTVEKRRDRDYEVEFCNVSFRYPGSESYALRNVSMKFKIGSRLAIVGRNGSGKTTFIKLLCRLYDPTEGQILLNGIDIRKYNYLDYMSIFSVVFQDFRLFSLKLGENVASKIDYDSNLVTDCLQKAGFSETLQKMPDGVETYLYKDYNKDGINVSGGEAQKIAIARALYKNAPFIILDEPTAALDPIAEAEIYSKFNDIAGDKTAIYISHRLSSCKFCDEIAVFHEGAVVQQGTHAELTANENGMYYELWNAQAQYYTE